MTEPELTEVQGFHDLLTSLQTYRTAVDSESESAVAAMLISTSRYNGMGAEVKAAWLAAIDADLADTQAAFDAFVGTIV